MNIFNCTLRTLFSFLEKEGYEKSLEKGQGDIVIVRVPDCDDDDPRCYRSLGFEVRRFDDPEKFMDHLDTLFCGGMFLVLVIFVRGRNVTYHYKGQLSNYLPGGDMKIKNDDL